MTLALDFGTCNTVLARWNPATRQVESLAIDGLSRAYAYQIPGTSRRRFSMVIPSIIHYGEDDVPSIGAHVENAGLADHRNSFRWLKLDLLRGHNRSQRINTRLVTPRQAADNFIQQVLATVVSENTEDLVVTLPVEAYDSYVDWLQAAVTQVFHGRIRMLDEATACLLGYDTQIREGWVYVLFDFGGGTLDISVVKALDLASGRPCSCTVLGRAGEEIGGATVDRWLIQDIKRAQNLSDAVLAELGIALLHAVEDAKIRLSQGEAAVQITQCNESNNRCVSHQFTCEALRRLLATERETLGKRSLYQLIALTVERALDQAQEKYGTRKSEIRGVFMVGGSSLLLGITDLVRTLFPDRPVHCENPFEAIVRGACRYASDDINLALVHDYCLRAWDPLRQDYVLVPVIPKGTRYPTEEPVAVKYVKAACEGAARLGLVITERSDMVRPEDVWEVVGGRLQRRETHWREDNTLREINPIDREFIHADPPCTAGARRFVAGFGVDAHKRLTLSLKDLDPNSHSEVQLSNGERLKLPIRDMPFVKL